jgi:hypothetical protein
VIASLNCGQVVKHCENGLLLPAVSGPAIAQAIEVVLKAPAQLPMMSICSKKVAAEHSVEKIFPKFVSGVTDVLENAC